MCIGVADGPYAGPIISADAARDLAVLHFYSIMCCIIVVTAHCVPAAYAKMKAEIETSQMSRTSFMKLLTSQKVLPSRVFFQE